MQGEELVRKPLPMGIQTNVNQGRNQFLLNHLRTGLHKHDSEISELTADRVWKQTTYWL